MTSTERKLDEAKYFFNLLNIDDPYFDYILSAFLNAARSVAWIMRHEFNKANGWEKWFNEYYLPEKAKQLLKEINDLRIETTKKAGLKTDFFFLESDLYIDEKYYPQFKKLKELEDGEYILSIEPISNEPKELEEGAIQFVGKIARTEKPHNDSRQKLKNTCEEYLNFMGDAVKACVNNFDLNDD